MSKLKEKRKIENKLNKTNNELKEMEKDPMFEAMMEMVNDEKYAHLGIKEKIAEATKALEIMRSEQNQRDKNNTHLPSLSLSSLADKLRGK